MLYVANGDPSILVENMKTMLSKLGDNAGLAEPNI